MDDSTLKPTKTIVAAFFTNHAIAVTDVVALIHSVHRSLGKIAAGGGEEPKPTDAPLNPAVPVRRSVTPDYLICLEDGKRFKSLRRHLRTAHGLDPAAYRARWGLKKDYPVTAPNYSAERTAMAKSIGLGQRGAERAAAATPVPSPQKELTKAPAKRAQQTKVTVPVTAV